MEFKWHSEQQSAFDKLKELITSTSALAHVDVNRKTRILVDVSPVGLGEVLIQLQRVEWRGYCLCFKRPDSSRKEVQPDRERSLVTGVGLRTL